MSTINKPTPLKEVKKTKKKLDKERLLEWRNNAIKKYGNKCEYCGSERYINAHHFYSRSDYRLRYDVDNCFLLCSLHHTLGSQFSAHKTPADFVEWAIKKRGEKWYKDLQHKHWSR